eukprot:UN14212
MLLERTLQTGPNDPSTLNIATDIKLDKSWSLWFWLQVPSTDAQLLSIASESVEIQWLVFQGGSLKVTFCDNGEKLSYISPRLDSSKYYSVQIVSINYILDILLEYT